MTHEWLYQIVEVSDGYDKVSTLYNRFMLVGIVLRLGPLAFREEAL